MIVACPECRGAVSDVAVSCPHCGYVRGSAPPATVVVQPTKPGFFDPGANCRGCIMAPVVFAALGVVLLLVMKAC